MSALWNRTEAFCGNFALRLPILLAPPMASACPPALSVAVAEGGGHRGCFEATSAERQQVGLVASYPKSSMPCACRSWQPEASGMHVALRPR